MGNALLRFCKRRSYSRPDLLTQRILAELSEFVKEDATCRLRDSARDLPRTPRRKLSDADGTGKAHQVVLWGAKPMLFQWRLPLLMQNCPERLQQNNILPEEV